MKRILSLLPSTTEIIHALGAERALVGITHECDFPPEARRLPQVTSARISPAMASAEIDTLVREQLDQSGTLYALDMDLVEKLRPEIVLTQQLCTVCAVGYETVHHAMQSLAVPPEVINIEPRTLDEVIESISRIATMLELKDHGQQVTTALRNRIEMIPPVDPRPSVLFLEWLIPPFSAGHWMAELVEAAGGQPVLHDRGNPSRRLEWEQIHREAFDVLVISCCGFDVVRTMTDVESCDDLHRLREARPELRVIVLDGNHFFSRPGPRLIESAEVLHDALTGRTPEKMKASIENPYREI